VRNGHVQDFMTDQQVNTIKHVGEANRIAQCCGYDFFVIEGL